MKKLTLAAAVAFAFASASPVVALPCWHGIADVCEPKPVQMPECVKRWRCMIS